MLVYWGLSQGSSGNSDESVAMRNYTPHADGKIWRKGWGFLRSASIKGRPLLDGGVSENSIS